MKQGGEKIKAPRGVSPDLAQSSLFLIEEQYSEGLIVASNTQKQVGNRCSRPKQNSFLLKQGTMPRLGTLLVIFSKKGGNCVSHPGANFDFLKTQNNTSSWYFVGITPEGWE